MQEIFEKIRQVFAPGSDTTFDEIMKKIQWHIRYEKVIDAHEKNRYNDNFIQRDQEKAAWSYFGTSKLDQWQVGRVSKNTRSEN